MCIPVNVRFSMSVLMSLYVYRREVMYVNMQSLCVCVFVRTGAAGSEPQSPWQGKDSN